MAKQRKTVEEQIFSYFNKIHIRECCIKNCYEKSIKKSHSIPKSFLKKGEKKLYQIHHDNFRDYNPLFREVTLNSGIFYNFFCNKHDSKIFKDIENSENIYSADKQKFLFCLKALFYSLSYCNNFLIYHKEKLLKENLEKGLKLIIYILENKKNLKNQKALIYSKIKQEYREAAEDLDEKMKNKNFSYGSYICDKILEKLSPSEIESKLTKKEYLNFILDLLKSYNEKKYFEDFIDIILKTNKGHEVNLKLKEKEEELLIDLGIGKRSKKGLSVNEEKIYDKGNYSKIKTKTYKVSEKLPIFSNSVFFPYISDYLINSNNAIFFSLFPDGNKTVCLISYLKENEKFDSLISEIISEDRIKDIIFNLSMLGNNVIFTEEFKDKLRDKENEFLEDYEKFKFQKVNHTYESVFTIEKRKKYQIF